MKPDMFDTILTDPTFTSQQKSAARAALDAGARSASTSTECLCAMGRLVFALSGGRGRGWRKFVRSVETITGRKVN